MLLKYIILIFTIAYTTSTANAIQDPMPFGISIGKTTINQLVNTHKVLESTADNIKGYTKNLVSVNEKSKNSQIICITNPDDIIEAITMKLDKNYFEKLQKQFSDKYALVNSQVTNKGDRAMLFAVNNSYLILLRDVPSQESVEVVYSTRDLFVKRTATSSYQKES